jgi:hypothetical protein
MGEPRAGGVSRRRCLQVRASAAAASGGGGQAGAAGGGGARGEYDTRVKVRIHTSTLVSRCAHTHTHEHTRAVPGAQSRTVHSRDHGQTRPQAQSNWAVCVWHAPLQLARFWVQHIARLAQVHPAAVAREWRPLACATSAVFGELAGARDYGSRP